MGVTGGPTAIREVLPEPGMLVVKQGARGATAFDGERDGGRAHRLRPAAPVPGPAQPTATTATTATFVSAPTVQVSAAVGAGDAFAAGFLSATLRGLPVRDRLRHGHLMAAAALTAPGDLAVPPTRAHADRLAALDDRAWGTLRLGPGWIQALEGADEEVRTP